MPSIEHSFLLFCCILDHGKGSDVLKLIKSLGGFGETIFFGKGTIKDKWLNVLGVLETRKEVLFAVISKVSEDSIYEQVGDKFGLEKPGRGIAFSMPLKYYLPVEGIKRGLVTKKGVHNVTHEAIFAIANKSAQDIIIQAAESAGSTGGTIIHGRGSGTQEKATLFNIEIEPEKVIVLILSKVERTDAIVESIQKTLNVHEPNTGVVFVMDVSKALGLYEGQSS
ncbi:MAG: P-II family nitrogen regulator [Firmicutes bacterium]|nr:P-II family nitrogen regulator [Bacillota bacterium]